MTVRKKCKRCGGKLATITQKATPIMPVEITKEICMNCNVLRTGKATVKAHDVEENRFADEREI